MLTIWQEQPTYSVQWKAADGTWQTHSEGWTEEEAMRVVWTSGLTDRVVFRIRKVVAA